MDLIANLAIKLAFAISIAEGFYVAGSVPARCHNPCDLELGDRGWGVDNGKTIFAMADPDTAMDDRTDGWAAARRECLAILSGASFVYNVNMTFEEVAAKYTGGDNPGAWSRIVCEKLNVSPMDTLAEWVKASSLQPAAPTLPPVQTSS